MGVLKILSPSEQVAERLRSDLAAGIWQRKMPGVLRLEAELGVNRKAVEAGLAMLEQQGLLERQGQGRCRRIVSTRGAPVGALPMRVAILANEPSDLGEGYMVELRTHLQEAGHQAFFAPKCLMQLGSDADRIARMARETPADAWILCSAPVAVLEWFVAEGIAAFSLFGRRRGLPVAAAGPDKVPAYREAARRLVALGHRRIALLARKARRAPVPGAPERAFMAELADHGFPISLYNLPDWEESAEGLVQLLDALFQVTPPTALFVDEAPVFLAVKHRLASLGVKAPEEISLICGEPDRGFDWCRPSIAHVSWDSSPWIRWVVRWADNLGRGTKDVRHLETPARFVLGETIGPAKLPRF